MASAEITIDKSNKLINSSFKIKQFIVHNNSSFNIYIKRGGIPATIKDYDFIIAPNSDYTSATIDEISLSIYTNAQNFLNVAKIDIYDYVHSQPNTTPYITNQVLPNPTTFPYSKVLNLTKFDILPSVKFDNFIPIHYIFSGGFVNSTIFGGALMMHDGNNAIAGIDAQSYDNIITVNPLRLGTTFNAFIAVPDNPYILNVDQVASNQIIARPNINSITNYLLNTVTTGSPHIIYGIIKPPAFYWDVQISNSISNYDFNLTLEMFTFEMGNKITLLPTTNFSGVGGVNPVVNRLINPKQVICPEYRFLKATVENNIAASGYSLQIGLWNYNT